MVWVPIVGLIKVNLIKKYLSPHFIISQILATAVLEVDLNSLIRVCWQVFLGWPVAEGLQIQWEEFSLCLL